MFNVLVAKTQLTTLKDKGNKDESSKRNIKETNYVVSFLNN